MKAETTLFRVRYDTDKSDERRRFLNSRDFNWIEVSDTEKKQFRDELYASFHPPPKPNVKLSEQERKAEFEKEKYYKVRSHSVNCLGQLSDGALGQMDARARSRREAEGLPQEGLGLCPCHRAVKYRLPSF